MSRRKICNFLHLVACKGRSRRIIIPVQTRFRSDEQRNSAKLEPDYIRQTSLSTDVFIRSCQERLSI